MVLCNVECVQKVSKYLNVAPGKLYVSENNVVAAKNLLEKESLEGFSTIVQALAKLSQFSNILGNDAVTQALTRQWLEYVVLNVNYADNLGNAKRILKELNLILRKSTYITGTEKTVADVVLYYTLHSIMVRTQSIDRKMRLKNPYKETWINEIHYDCPYLLQQGLTHQEKAEHVNVSRWFDNIQQDEKLRQELELINFNLLHLYL